VRRLRRALGASAGEGGAIATVRGIGYRLDADGLDRT
jgi:DNA-binding response OmpR family regulator